MVHSSGIAISYLCNITQKLSLGWCIQLVNFQVNFIFFASKLSRFSNNLYHTVQVIRRQLWNCFGEKFLLLQREGYVIILWRLLLLLFLCGRRLWCLCFLFRFLFASRRATFRVRCNRTRRRQQIVSSKTRALNITTTTAFRFI